MPLGAGVVLPTLAVAGLLPLPTFAVAGLLTPLGVAEPLSALAVAKVPLGPGVVLPTFTAAGLPLALGVTEPLSASTVA